MKKHSIDPKMPPEEKERRDVVRQRAKDITATKSDNAIDGRLGVYIDGTGSDYSNMIELKNKFEGLGYISYLVVVNTKLDVALIRNQTRERTVPGNIVEERWRAVQENIGKYIQVFDNFSIIDNNGDKRSSDPDEVALWTETEIQIDRAYSKLRKFTALPPNKPVARVWIKSHTLGEASYPGNIGAMEMIKFRRMVVDKPELWTALKELIAAGKKRQAWELIQRITGTALDSRSLYDSIGESIDIAKGFPIEEWYEEEDTYATVALAHDSSGGEIEVLFTPLDEGGTAIDFDFTRGGSYEMTGGGEAGRVFATVLNALGEYLKDYYQPDYITFASKGDSRTRAYTSLIKRFAGRFGYRQVPYDSLPKEITDQPTPPGELFAFSRI
jgi:hypothetical protein